MCGPRPIPCRQPCFQGLLVFGRCSRWIPCCPDFELKSDFAVWADRDFSCGFPARLCPHLHQFVRFSTFHCNSNLFRAFGPALTTVKLSNINNWLMFSALGVRIKCWCSSGCCCTEPVPILRPLNHLFWIQENHPGLDLVDNRINRRPMPPQSSGAVKGVHRESWRSPSLPLTLSLLCVCQTTESQIFFSGERRVTK